MKINESNITSKIITELVIALEESTELLRYTRDENEEGRISEQIKNNERALSFVRLHLDETK